MIKLIAIDLDGTLLKSDKTISQGNLKALKYAHDKGVKVVICTGRPYFAMKSFIEEIGFTSPDDYIITYNGGQVQKAADGEVLVSNTMTEQQMRAWYTETERLQLPLNIIDKDYVYEPLAYPTGRESIYLELGNNLPTRKVDYHSFDKAHRFNKYVICIEEQYLDRQIAELQPQFRSEFSVVKSRPYLLEIMANNVTKGNALLQLGERLGIQPNEMMTMGDQENDLSMIELAGIGVAMGNAIPMIQTAADYISAHNEQDGVAQAIYQFIK
ncbi:Cof-type HAD-IIB family hydrolase [Aerococcaceae bacterium NML190938]|nr:Cof-type HAD-IIB family hydrolase [Aerococcaceae bacterium NML190938]